LKVLVTGAAGFIGMHAAQALLARGDRVVGLDNLNDYYDPRLKHDRLARLGSSPHFRFESMDIADRGAIADLFASERFDKVVHLAAQPGVRYSLTHPQAYIDSNLVGFANVLEACRHGRIEHLVCASSSSVYGGNTRLPYSEQDSVDHPVSLYAATKKASELMAHAYSHLYRLPTTGLRFFTVYGPWGRPDMAYFLFTKAILERQPIDVFNHGRMVRDFTYIDDIVEGVVRVLDRDATPSVTHDAARPGPATVGRSLPRLQHRQPRPGRSDGVHRSHRACCRAAGTQALRTAARGRHAVDRCRHVRTGRVDRLPARHADGRRRRPLRALVPRLLSRLTADEPASRLHRWWAGSGRISSGAKCRNRPARRRVATIRGGRGEVVKGRGLGYKPPPQSR